MPADHGFLNQESQELHLDDSASLRLYARIPRTRVLGPFVRYGLWVQGCPFRCPGCMTPDALAFTGGEEIAIAGLVSQILAIDEIEGLSVSGGEPFAQAAALALLMRQLRSQRDLGLILYSGYRWRDLQRQARLDPGVALVDSRARGRFQRAGKRGWATIERPSANAR